MSGIEKTFRGFLAGAALFSAFGGAALAQPACVPDLPGDLARARRYDALILRHSQLRRVNPRLVKAIIAVESQFAPRALSPRGARGLMQLMPETALEMGVTPDALSDPDANILAGTRYLAELFAALRRRRAPTHPPGESWELRRVIAAYNAGPGALTGDEWPASTRRYVRDVLKCYRSQASELARL